MLLGAIDPRSDEDSDDEKATATGNVMGSEENFDADEPKSEAISSETTQRT